MMSGEGNSFQEGNINPPQREGEIWVDLNDEQQTATASQVYLKTMQSLRDKLQSFKVDNMKENEEHQELNVVLLQILTKIKTSNNQHLHIVR